MFNYKIIAAIKLESTTTEVPPLQCILKISDRQKIIDLP